MKFLGIDPDLKGGLSLIEHTPESRTVKMAYRMPVTEKKPPLNEPVRVDAVTLWNVLMESKAHGVDYVILEMALVMQQGRGSMMGAVDRVHQNFGAIRALCELAFTRNRVMLASPSAWKKALGLTSDKELSRKMALDLYPSHANLLSKVKNTGLAESMLLTEWARGRFQVH